MSQHELKKILKPLIKQCIKEVIFEEGVLSGIISEVVKGTASQKEVIKATPPPDLNEGKEEYRKKLNETKQKMLEAIGRDSYGGIFEGVEPLSSGGTPGAGASPGSPLANFDPNDAGVDVSGLFGSISKNWKKMI